ncbi:MAG: hydrogenase maturation nickel metallochaperone HypA [Rhodobacteraceae bacterium]|nr:hydrogenase maturation nickel metallochaperone HypA [Paracoccaceae bacterium]
MHELSLCEELRRIVEEAARAHGVARVTRVRVEVGRFAAVEPAALELAFGAVMRGSVAEGAELVLVELPGRALCLDCGREVALDDRFDPCPECGGGRLLATGGDEMRIRDMEAA